MGFEQPNATRTVGSAIRTLLRTPINNTEMLCSTRGLHEEGFEQLD